MTTDDEADLHLVAARNLLVDAEDVRAIGEVRCGGFHVVLRGISRGQEHPGPPG